MVSKLFFRKYIFCIIILHSFYIHSNPSNCTSSVNCSSSCNNSSFCDSSSSSSCQKSCNQSARTIFIPRQMAYNPIYENALVFNEYTHLDSNDYKDSENKFLISAKPFYTQTVGRSLKKYFSIDQACSMTVNELGSGDIDSLWFQVISKPNTYYSSILSFNPIQKTYGAMLYSAYILPHDFAITINTAVMKRKNNMHLCEKKIENNSIGQVSGFSTVTEAFKNPDMKYGKICGTQSKSGFDDVQIKFLKNFKLGENKSIFLDVYGLLGIPTGQGSKAVYLFEPIVGSQHVQLGLGLNAEKSFEFHENKYFSLYGEAKWRYGLAGTEVRSFDLTPNGQWSRYMLFTTPTCNEIPFVAINNLTFDSKVTPRNAVDLLVAAHIETKHCSFELGYNFWYRQSERVCPYINLGNVGIADLIGIAQIKNPMPVTVTSSSKATISQGVYPNEYQMPRDATYTSETKDNINILSGTQPQCMTNGIFGSIGYHYHGFDFSINASYEASTNNNSSSIVSVWTNIDIRF